MINTKKNWESESVLVLNVVSKKCFRKTFMKIVSTSFFLNWFQVVILILTETHINLDIIPSVM